MMLAEDGVLLVSINDDQRALLELMMDEALPGMRKSAQDVWRVRTMWRQDRTRAVVFTAEAVHLCKP